MRIKLLFIAVCMATVCFAKTINVNQTYNHYVELTPFSSVSNASSVTITGSVTLNSDTSLVRILLIDNVGEESMLFESYSMIVDTNSYSFSNYTDETKYLHNIKPQSLRIYAEDATVYIQSIYVNTNVRTSTLEQTEGLRYNYYKSMNQQKIAKMNSQISKRGMRWTAGETEWGNLYFEDKYTEFGGNRDYNSYGLEYHIDGIFAIPQGWETSMLKSEPSVVFEYDIRNLHNALNPSSPYYNPNSIHGWLTPTKNQYIPHACGSCWAFAAVATVEGITNLYFNKHIDFDLSEQYILSCSGAGSCSGGWPQYALNYIHTHGIVDEDCAPYYGTDTACSTLDLTNKKELVFISDTVPIDINTSNIKESIIEYGPLAVIITGHAMSLIGWREYADGSLSWICKNSSTWNNIESGIRLIGENSILYLHRTSYTSSLHLSESDRVCADMDGDGYYNWGIGTKPATCPDCAPDTPDGNDADPTIGPINDYGQPILPFTPVTIPDTEVTTSQTWSNNRTICGDLIIKNNATLTLTGTIAMQASHRIYVKSGAKLVINGGKTSLAGITVENGGILTLNGNGTIEIFNPADVIIAVGGLLNHNYGKINVVNPFLPN
ncbi:MAG: hypothetical protein IKJ98_07610 [Bacteroidales bacterium]|nr:hypothetical protein [Bacteroidales bacterium]